MATSKKFTPRTKHIAVKHHHFREAVNSGSIQIHHVHTLKQLADKSTKPLKVDQFGYVPTYVRISWVVTEFISLD